MLFTVEARDRVRDRLLELARKDERIVAGAVIGSDAEGLADRWSDLDLTFGVADGARVGDVLSDWTALMAREFDAVRLFDLAHMSSTYRVFLLPGNLQVDLSFTPAAEFGALGPKFRLLFGEAVKRPQDSPPPPDEIFGLGAHHAVRARLCIERAKPWQAEHWISGVRDQALTLACRRRQLETAQGRGFDRLPPEVLKQAEPALVAALDRASLLSALQAALESLLREASEVPDAERLGPQLRELGR